MKSSLLSRVVPSAWSALSQVAFPDVCICCGHAVARQNRTLCEHCRRTRFDVYQQQKDLFLPNHVRFLYAMWAFDRGGYLQDLLHRLKYDYLRTTGTELGRLIARNLPNSVLNPIEESGRTVYLLPVPLHPSKQRKRGYNQAGAIAEGIAEITGWELTPSELAVRLRHTKTQTGLNRAGRQKNVSGAFSIVRADDLRDAVVVIVDDVFTTGATVFELADTLDHQIGEARDGFTGVITVAGA